MLDVHVALGDHLAIGVVQLEALLEGEEVLGAVVAVKGLRDLLAAAAHPGILQGGELDGVALPSEDGAEDAHAGGAGDVTDHLLPASADAPFDTVVVLMMENRSFDHLRGWLPGANGLREGLVGRSRGWDRRVELARKMCDGYAPFTFSSGVASDMPTITSLEDRRAWVARLRRIMENSQQVLLANCVADYVIDQL